MTQRSLFDDDPIVLTPADQTAFAEAIVAPPAPSDRLVALAKEARARSRAQHGPVLVRLAARDASVELIAVGWAQDAAHLALVFLREEQWPAEGAWPI